MTLQDALKAAMASANLRDEEVAVKTHVSAYTIQSIRLGRTRSPRRIVVDALRREVPGLAELLDKAVA